ncbi:ABC transporter ATP-binding protein [Thioclava sp. SK-1]|uniref:ABC transporter ATP-binding protein n=1 Tax=Thioclava sp. SK-1 TaxID=1889770 RepID=UPI0008265233|nr:ABC transporter ATP-binding protein [Thioclava sp. SK-1]OCX62261.1 ABC transporter ATP-binding protein [Thioclava sp. SK-1]
MNEPALQIQGLSHRWHRKLALEDVSLTLPMGRFTALLGPNGAGKSTLISVLTGLIRPARDVVRINGVDLGRTPQAALTQIGVVFQQPTMDLDRSVHANLDYFAALHGMDRKTRRTRISQVLERLSMAERANERLRDLNGGHRRRMEIARALIHRPKLLLLDEPTTGLDSGSRHAITDHVHDLCADGLSVLWCTHLTDEIRPSDQMILLHKGRVVVHGDVDALTGAVPLGQWFLQRTAA